MYQTNYIIPTYENGVWTTTEFKDRIEIRDFVRSVFKDAGPNEGYNFTVNISIEFNSQARKFQKDGYYCNAPIKSKDFMNYWDEEKAKCRNGVIYKEDGLTWYLTRDYYMWLNFLPIYDKEEKRFDFAKVRDAQYHMALYEILAELSYKHVPILKKRQIASSYFHMGKLINQYWFEEGSVNKIGASLKDYISEKGSWRMLNEYRNFLNEHTAWYRPSEPDKVFSWQQRIKVRTGGRDTYKGNKSIITGTSFEKDPTNGVGGPVSYFFHEEAGIAPKMMDTYEFMRPAMQSGMVTTGTFIAAGSVGDLDQCQPLKEMILYPHKYGMFAITSNLIDNNGTIGETGLFIPEQWSMPPYIDKAGNSLVNDALEAIYEERKQWKKDLSPEQYQLRISQKPTNIEEAFATRKESVFPPHLISHQIKRIEDGDYPIEYVELSINEENKIVAKKSNRQPIKKFPIDKTMEDKSGVICVYERPIPNVPWGTYYASIDPVGEGRTTTSDSLCSIFIYKNPTEVIKDEGNGKVNSHFERDGIVASWCGRFDDLQKTHERLEMLIEWYNAWTLVENNVSLFIQYMISKRKQKYLVPKDQIPFLKELSSNANVFATYGWKNTGTLFKTHLISYGIQFLQEELDVHTNKDGEITKIHYGVERIPDIMLLEEMKQYQPGLNVDRLVSFCSLVAFAQIQQNNRGKATRVEIANDKLENTQKLSKLSVRTPFRHMGINSGSLNKNALNTPPRNAFKNIR
jgi:hypothetical protein